MRHDILCTNPKIVRHRLFGEFLSRTGCFVIRGKRYFVPRKMAFFEDRFPYLDKLFHFTPCVSDLDDCYFLDVVTGEIYPMFIQVRCGKCDNCRASKVNSLVHRCKLETMYHKSLPIFLTLTYDEKHKPKDGVCLRDCQLFFKRLRINLQRAGYKDAIRYLLVAEYGKTTSRPHYHCILWNLHQSDFLSYFQIGEVIKKSWHNGFEIHRLIDPRNDKAFYYTSKYLSKGSNVPDGQNKTFMVSSNRGGAIGALFLDVLKGDIRKSMNIKPSFYNKYTGKVEEIQMSKYVLNRLFPSFSQMLPSPVKSAVKRFVYNFHVLKQYETFDKLHLNLYQFIDDYEGVYKYFSRFMYLYEPSDGDKVHQHDSIASIIRQMLSDLSVCTSFMTSKGIYFDPRPSDELRKSYLEKFFRNKLAPNLSERGRKFRRSVDYSSQFEIL